MAPSSIAYTLTWLQSVSRNQSKNAGSVLAGNAERRYSMSYLKNNEKDNREKHVVRKLVRFLSRFVSFLALRDHDGFGIPLLAVAYLF